MPHSGGAQDEPPKSASVDVINANSKRWRDCWQWQWPAIKPKCQLRAHTGNPKHISPVIPRSITTYTHDEPTDAKLGYQINTSKLAGLVMQALGDFLVEMDSIKEGDGTLLDNMAVLAFSDTGTRRFIALKTFR